MADDAYWAPFVGYYRYLRDIDLSAADVRHDPRVHADLAQLGLNANSASLDRYWSRVEWTAAQCHGAVLEIGACAGNVTRWILENPRVESVTAVELSPALAAACRELDDPRLQVQAGSVQQSDLRSSYDCVVLGEVIEHLSFDEELALLDDLLGRSAVGQFVVTTPLGFMSDPDHRRGLSAWQFGAHVRLLYGRPLASWQNRVQQGAAIRYRRRDPVARSLARLMSPLTTARLWRQWRRIQLLPTHARNVLRRPSTLKRLLGSR